MFYGWKIVGAAHTVCFITSASLFYSFSLFLQPIADELEIGRAQVSLIPVMSQLFGGVAALSVGNLIGRYSIRRIMLFGAGAAVFGYFVSSKATSIWQLCIIAAVCFSLAGQSLALLIPQALIVNWFDRLRGRALGITQLGVSFGGVFAPPAIAYSIASFGWRTTYEFFSASFLVAIGIIAVFIVNRPEDLGLRPDGDAVGSSEDRPPPRPIGLGGEAHPRVFWVICAMLIGSFISGPTLMPHLVPIATDQGIDPLRASWLVVVLGSGSMTAKLLFGFLIERLPMRSVFMIMMTVMLAGLVLVAAAETNWVGAETSEETFSTLLIASALYAIGIGGMLPVSAGLISDAFGRVGFARKMGRLTIMMTPLAFGSYLSGWTFDTYGYYTPVILTLIAVATASLLAGFLYPLPLPDQPESP